MIGDRSEGVPLRQASVPSGLRPTTPTDRIGHSNPTLEKMGDNPTMPAIRPIAALAITLVLPFLAWAQAPAPGPAPAQPAAPSIDSTTLANNVIFETIVRLRTRARIAARVEQVVDMLNQRFELKGNYYKDTGNRIRLQLDLVGLGDNGSTMLQICDGKILWEYQKVLGMKNYRKREIVPILKRLEEPSLDEEFRVQVMTQLGFGGPEALITGFQSTIAFDQFADKVVDGVPTYVLGGKWKDRNGLLERPIAPTDPLPPYIPSNIQVFVDKATLWPYRIEMRGVEQSVLVEDNRQIDPITKRPIGVRRPQPKVDPTNITLRYTLLPDSEIKPDEQFVFNTPRDATNLVDETEQFLNLLDQAIAYKLNEKKAKEAAEGANSEATIKTDAIPLPSSTPAPIVNPAPEPSAPK